MTRTYTRQPAECLVASCGRRARAGGLCMRHYEYRRHHGVTTPEVASDPGEVQTLPQSLEPNFWSTVVKGEPEECWLYRRMPTPEGYGTWSWREAGRMRGMPAHRAAYIFANGGIPKNLTIDHLCRTRRCCNPRHLEAVTRHENMARAVANRELSHAEDRDCGWAHCVRCRALRVIDGVV